MYELPEEEEIRTAIYLAMKRYKNFDSLTALHNAVLNELKKINDNYAVSMKRVRIIAARSGFIKLDIKTKEGEGKPDRCPVCGGRLEKIKSLSLLGEEIIIGYRCKLCAYKTGMRKNIPVRYHFHFLR